MDVNAIIDKVASHAMELGVFVNVVKHEPKSAPTNDLSYAVYLNSIQPIALASGLAVTSARVELTGRIYRGFLTQPEDLVDPDLADATSQLVGAYTGNFQLDGLARNIDLLGAHGPGLGAQAGYLTIEKRIYRVMDIRIPVIVNDVWDQVA